MTSPLLLDGKIALVTGASSGIGEAIARAYARAGATVILTARRADKLERIAAAIEAETGRAALPVTGDVTDEKSVLEIYKDIHKRHGRLDILAANAGQLADGLIGMIAAQNLHDMLAVNTIGVLNHLQAATRLMRRGGGGSIVITSSIIGRTGNAGQAAYAASKAATLGLMMSAAKELGRDKIRVNALAPGFIETAMTSHLSQAVREERLKGIALGRMGTPEDVADVALFLASDMARYVSGQVIGVDGCMVI